MRRTKPTPSLIRIIPALIHIQAHLDQDLSLDLLADEVRLSKYHFHQLFRRVTGETPKSYVDRLRLERAAVQLRIRRADRVGNRVGMRLPESRDVQPGISRSIRHVAARLSTAVVSSGERPTKRAIPARDERGAIRPALDNSHRAARSHDRRIYSSRWGPTNELQRTTSNA